ncbi:MAG: inositol monophosphatase [Alphaproteobacteria bacterium]|nr:inositol monophosphatase [Alphaproteobacteria bacterium]
MTSKRTDTIESFRQLRQRKSYSALSPLLNVMIDAAYKAGKPLIRDFGEVEKLSVTSKGAKGFVSSADLRAEKTIVDALKKARPTYSFATEETGDIPGEDPDSVFYVDPIDGTTNFLRGIPNFAVLIACAYKNKLHAGVVYMPMYDQLIYAEKGGGAYCISAGGTTRLRVSGHDSPMSSVISLSMPNSFDNKGRLKRLKNIVGRLTDNPLSVRSFGLTGMNMSYTAMGKTDGGIELFYAPWDVAAPVIILREAGGKVSTPDGSEDDMEILNGSALVNSNGLLHGFLRDVAKE